MTITGILTLLLFLYLKHFLVDFPLQTPYHYLNKGKYGHWGGIDHALGHFWWTYMVVFIVLLIYDYRSPLLLAGVCAVFDGILHYHIDWAKNKIKDHYKWGPTTHEQFWILTGLDQFLHAVTYLLIAVFIAMQMKAI